MSPAGDGIDDVFEELFQHGMVISSQIGREISRVWETQLKEKATLSEREATRLQMAFDTEKRTAKSVLKPTTQKAWWDQAKPSDVADAYRVASAWSAHDPAAAEAQKVILEQAATRFGLDTETLKHPTPGVTESPAAGVSENANVVLEKEALKQPATAGVGMSAVPGVSEAEQRAVDLQAAKDYFAQNNPERLLAFQKQGWVIPMKEEVEYHQTFIKDWKEAALRDKSSTVDLGVRAAEVKVSRGQAYGLEEAAASEFADARQGLADAQTALIGGPSPAEEAWYRDTFLAEAPEIDQAYERSANFMAVARKDDAAGRRLLGQAESAHVVADRQEQLVARVRAGVGGEEGVAALQFAQGQQKFPIAHAAAGKGKSVNKVKANGPQKTAAKSKLISR